MWPSMTYELATFIAVDSLNSEQRRQLLSGRGMLMIGTH